MKSDKWAKKKTHLEKKEKELRENLNLAGDEFMTQAKKTSLIALGVGSTVLVGYLAYRFFFHEKKEIVEAKLTDKKAEVKIKSSALDGVKKAFTEKMMSQAVNYAGDRLINYLDSIGVKNPEKKKKS